MTTSRMRTGVTLCLAIISLLAVQAQQRLSPDMRKLQFAEMAIESLYVDSVNETSLVEAAIRGMLQQLDPHSAYATAEEVRKMSEPLQGNFEGIGVQFNMVEDTLLVIQPVSGGPSEKAGILAGDRIVAVNDSAIAGVKMDQNDIMRRLRGPKGSSVALSVVRRGVSELLHFTVKRDKIPIYSLDASYMIRPHIGYIRLSRFAATTADEFKGALKKLQKDGVRDLILDLQGNGGGFMAPAIALANEFLQKGELIVYTQGRRSQRMEYTAQGNGSFRQGRLIVLIDEFSASASEILAGAIQDWDRGYIVGRRSFGKGLVQRPIPLPDNSEIRLTVSRYYTPSGRCIQKPYTKSEGDAYDMELNERFKRGEMLHADSIHYADSLKYKTRKEGRTVYGGGGIIPDYFVPMDTTTYTPYHREIVRKGVLLKTVARFIEAHRTELKKKYAHFEAYKTTFTVDEALLSMLRGFADEAKIVFNQQQYDKALPYIRLQLKAYIARDLWEMNQFYQIYNEEDRTVRKALELLMP